MTQSSIFRPDVIGGSESERGGAKRLTNRVICVIEVELDRHHLRGWGACVTEKTTTEMAKKDGMWL